MSGDSLLKFEGAIPRKERRKINCHGSGRVFRSGEVSYNSLFLQENVMFFFEQAQEKELREEEILVPQLGGAVIAISFPCDKATFLRGGREKAACGRTGFGPMPFRHRRCGRFCFFVTAGSLGGWAMREREEERIGGRGCRFCGKEGGGHEGAAAEMVFA